jgi:hypothetical protein
MELRKEESEIANLKEQVARQASMIRRIEAQIKSGVIVEEQIVEDRPDEEQIKRVQELAASMTDW